MKLFNFIEPVLIQTGDESVLLGGEPPKTDCRFLSEGNYQYLKKCRKNAFELLDALHSIRHELGINGNVSVKTHHKMDAAIKNANKQP